MLMLAGARLSKLNPQPPKSVRPSEPRRDPAPESKLFQGVSPPPPFRLMQGEGNCSHPSNLATDGLPGCVQLSGGGGCAPSTFPYLASTRPLQTTTAVCMQKQGLSNELQLRLAFRGPPENPSSGSLVPHIPLLIRRSCHVQPA